MADLRHIVVSELEGRDGTAVPRAEAFQKSDFAVMTSGETGVSDPVQNLHEKIEPCRKLSASYLQPPCRMSKLP